MVIEDYWLLVGSGWIFEVKERAAYVKFLVLYCVEIVSTYIRGKLVPVAARSKA
jgi:hypothetical protein